jgi:hypothetical protein
LLLDTTIAGHISLNIVAVQTVEGIGVKISPSQKRDQRVAKEHVGVGGDDKLATSPADADILRDHLKQWDRIRVTNRFVRGEGHLDKPNGEKV